MSNPKHPAGHVLQAFHDGELNTSSAAEVTLHLEQCQVCRSELAELKDLDQLLAKAPAPELPRTVWHRVRPGRPQETRFKPAFGIAACAAGILLGLLIGPIQSSTDQSSNELAWSENVTVWDANASSSLLGVYQTTSD